MESDPPESVTRRSFLKRTSLAAAAVLAADAWPVLGQAASGTGDGKSGLAEPAWREPGQVKDAAYLGAAALRYHAEDRQIIGRNRTCFNNRPLYCESQYDCVVLTGDRPFLRLLAEPYVLGAFSAAIVREGRGRWFHEASEVESRYRCGKMTWQIRDPLFAGAHVRLTAVPLRGAGGFALRFQGEGWRSGDRLVWAFGGASHEPGVREKWDPVMRGNPKIYRTGDPRKQEADLAIDAAKCRGNRAWVEERSFQLLAAGDARRIAAGQCDRPGSIFVGDGSCSSEPERLLKSTADQLPMVCGAFDLKAGGDEAHWIVEAVIPVAKPKVPTFVSPAAAFQAAEGYLQTIECARVETPEPRLDAAVAAVCHPIDALCNRDPVFFRHGCMAFFIEFMGWRVRCGATALGWHDRLRDEAARYAGAQVKAVPGHEQPQADPLVRWCLEGRESRFWGSGRIAPNAEHMYNTQTQFIDQVIRDWRWTADPQMEQILRPMLELHLEWARACFDSDDDGLYESYINTLPTDSVWYGGGGGVEETAYAYSGHLAAADMARRAGDDASHERHQRRAEKIRRALNDELWLKERGHFGLYREQGAHRRVHSDAWVYSQFLPIDAGMTSLEQSLQALYYTEWALERVPLPYGGELCQPSNWVPWKWSGRDVFGGDICALALAYFQTGLADEGWELLLGETLESAYAGAVPGGMSHIGAGTDFGDNVHMYARTVAEGLFGYQPDYPNGRVRIAPAFPSAWPKAAIQTRDFSVDFSRDGETDRYRLTIAQPAELDLTLSVRAQKVVAVLCDGQPVRWEAEPGFGCTRVRLRLASAVSADVAILLAGRLAPAAAISLSGTVGSELSLVPHHGSIRRYRDFHGVLQGAKNSGSAIHARTAALPGAHLVLAEILAGDLPQFQVFKIQVANPSVAARLPRSASPDARWKLVDLSPHHNGDIRAIFRQNYLSPRPKTCSVRLGADGYSAWTFPYWQEKPPVIDLANLGSLSDGSGRFVTPQGVPFRPFGEERNIAFTSLWDNWPAAVVVPVAETGNVAWMLVCGSTFPMQTRIANAEIRFRYADGVVETLEIVPPLNFWSLCPWGGNDYSYSTDGFCLPKEPPLAVQLGNHCRAIALSWPLRRGVELREVTLETLSSDVVIGLMGLSVMSAP